MFFEASIRKDGKGYRVVFRGLPNVLTYAENRGKALTAAREALIGCLLEDLDRGLDLPAPVPARQRSGTALVPVPPSIGVALILRRLRRKKGWTTVTVARSLGVTRQAYEKLERGKGNPSLQTLEKVFGVLGVEFDLVTTPRQAA